MIKINRSSVSVPAKLSSDGIIERTANESQFNNGKFSFVFKNSIYGHSSVKKSLKESQYNKCAYCESKVSSVAYGDVEHFRPKGGWKQDESQINLTKPGYYWLAYDWDNLLFSCQICNQIYKKNYFPLQDPSLRALSHNDSIRVEKCLLLNPLVDDPEQDITFNQHIVISHSIEGQKTIEVCGLDRDELNNSREELYLLVSDMINLVKIYEGSIDHVLKNKIKPLVNTAKNNLRKRILASSQFSSMIKTAIKRSGIQL